MVISEQKIRNIGLIAHINAGKTTLSESILYICGQLFSPGDVEDGTCEMDFLKEERERRISIAMALTNIKWNSYHINLIDTPGHIDFTAEVEKSLLAADSGVLIIDANSGIEAQTEVVFNQARENNLPLSAFLNKLDRSNDELLENILHISDNLGIICSEQGALYSAIALFEKALEINPENYKVHNNLGIAYDKKGQYELAEEEYKKALEINPQLHEAHYNSGIIYGMRGLYDESIKEFKKAIDLEPTDVHNHFNLALSYRRKGDIGGAIREYETALDLAPGFEEAKYNLETLYNLYN